MIVFVSGSSSGIGKAIAEKFLDEGAEVYGFDTADLTISRQNYHHIVHDIRSSNIPSLPEPEIIINSAGTIDESEAVDVNLKGAINFVSLFLGSSVLKSVLFIASASARNGSEFPLYVASKAGIIGYMKHSALALSKRGITCNSISPGGVITPMNNHILNDENLYNAVRNETLLGKWARPEEIAALAWYLTAVNQSITGEDILIDNGEMLKSNFIW